jgi:hypothetical protein
MHEGEVKISSQAWPKHSLNTVWSIIDEEHDAEEIHPELGDILFKHC